MYITMKIENLKTKEELRDYFNKDSEKVKQYLANNRANREFEKKTGHKWHGKENESIEKQTEDIKQFNKLYDQYEDDNGPGGVVELLKENNIETSRSQTIYDLLVNNPSNLTLDQWRTKLEFETLTNQILKLHGSDHTREMPSQDGIRRMKEELKVLQEDDESCSSIQTVLDEYNKITNSKKKN